MYSDIVLGDDIRIVTLPRDPRREEGEVKGQWGPGRGGVVGEEEGWGEGGRRRGKWKENGWGEGKWRDSEERRGRGRRGSEERRGGAVAGEG